MRKIDEQSHFLLKHGKNTSDRIAEQLLAAIMKTLSDNGIEFQGKKLTVKQLGSELSEDAQGNYGIIFDVMGVEKFDHVEFFVRKTGWGRAIHDQD